jgi:hypothetical protein
VHAFVSFVFAQVRSNPGAVDPGVWVGIVIALFAGVCGYLWYRDREQVRKLRERELAAFQQRNQLEQAQRERDGRAFSQHVALNDLQAKKLDLETKVLQAQLDAAERDKRARQLQEEFHRLVVDKTSLEIQSLKLHIREQKKRTDDFSSYDDE